MPRFVILLHEGSERGTHWDFMLEAGDALATWALLAEPAAGTRVEAKRLADHRAMYLDYEGPISGGRGSVARWDAGTYEVLVDGPLPDDELSREFVVQLLGKKLAGKAKLAREGDDPFWEFEG